MSTLMSAPEWVWLLMILCVPLALGVGGWIGWCSGWDHAVEDGLERAAGQHRKPRLALVPPLRFELEASRAVPAGHFAEPDPVVFGGAQSELFELPREFGCCEPEPSFIGGLPEDRVRVNSEHEIVAADDPSITTWTRQQAAELDRAIKAMIADNDTFIAGLGGGDR